MLNTAIAAVLSSPASTLVSDLLNVPASKWKEPRLDYRDRRPTASFLPARFATLTERDDVPATIYADDYADGSTITTVITLRGDSADLEALDAANPRLMVYDCGELVRLPGMRRQFIYDVNMTAVSPTGEDFSVDYVITLMNTNVIDIHTALLPEIERRAKLQFAVLTAIN